MNALNPNFLHITDESGPERVYMVFSLTEQGISYSCSTPNDHTIEDIPNSSHWTLEHLMNHFQFLEEPYWIQNAFYENSNQAIDFHEDVKDIRGLHILLY